MLPTIAVEGILMTTGHPMIEEAVTQKALEVLEMLRLMRLDPDLEQEVQVMVTIVIMFIHVLVEESREVDTTTPRIPELRVRFIDLRDLVVADLPKLHHHQEEVLLTVEVFVVLVAHPEVLGAQAVVHQVVLAEPPAVVEADNKIRKTFKPC